MREHVKLDIAPLFITVDVGDDNGSARCENVLQRAGRAWRFARLLMAV